MFVSHNNTPRNRLLLYRATGRRVPYECRKICREKLSYHLHFKSPSTTFAMVPFDGKYQNLYASSLPFLCSRSQRCRDLNMLQSVILKMKANITAYQFTIDSRTSSPLTGGRQVHQRQKNDQFTINKSSPLTEGRQVRQRQRNDQFTINKSSPLTEGRQVH